MVKKDCQRMSTISENIKHVAAIAHFLRPQRITTFTVAEQLLHQVPAS